MREVGVECKKGHSNLDSLRSVENYSSKVVSTTYGITKSEDRKEDKVTSRVCWGGVPSKKSEG